ncbi:metal ABC transporter substrate-binding protein [Natrarchaeobius oligotrophus]|uniref:Zinc ABC transporter substrate-binding protein n=1 Tax=Natrarchaeobius chitinivorans TaxID=1679083 RepID=A0A3N6N1D4_NATCH|nr:metal ABC transporter substrate-binding protein [Natrarchaeobius chitinivorans]RQH01347.1 zinc ABC transporter substrate-binding protein [Natrarchaeobius chitinivorans]
MVDDTVDAERYRITRRNALVGASGLAAGVAGCLGDDPQDDAGEPEDESDDGAGTATDDTGNGAGDTQYTVSTGFLALWDLTRNVAGDRMEVVDLVPIGQHGHEFDPGPGVVSDIEGSDVFIYLREFASWQDDAASELESDDDVHVIEAAEGIEFFDSPAEDDDEHVWMDPLEYQTMVDNVADELAAFDPDHADEYEANAAAFNEELQAVHEEFEDIVDRATVDQLIVGTHDSFQWWHRRYDIDIYSPVGTSPDDEASARDVEEIENVMDEYDLEHVLYDVGEPDNLAESIAAETGADVLPISPVETQLPEYHEQDWGYVDHYREVNFPTLEEALQTQ